MDAGEAFARLEANDARVEGVPEKVVEARPCDCGASSCAKTAARELGTEGGKREATGCVEPERLADQGRALWVRCLGLPLALVEIANRSGKRVEALLQPAVKSFSDLFAEVPDVIGGNDGLKVGGESSAPGPEIESFGREVGRDPALINEVAELDPVMQIAGAPIDLVEDRTIRCALAQQANHLREHGTAELRCGLALLKPSLNRESVLPDVPRDRIALLLKRHSVFALFQRRHAGVSKYLGVQGRKYVGG